MDVNQLSGMATGSARVKDPFWSPIMETTRTQMIPYQWQALNDQLEDSPPSGSIRNFRIAAGLEEGPFTGKVFQDSDVSKWIEAAAYTLLWHPDPLLEARIDGLIDLILKTQQPDHYIGTYYTINGLEKRWTNVMRHHELYCAGHMLEAAIGYYQATGKRKLLDAMILFVDYINSVFGPEEGKIHAYPGHEIMEMALMRLYAITGDEKHVKLAAYFIDERGSQPCYFEGEIERHQNTYPWRDSVFQFDYFQAGAPVREMNDAVGHAVRAVYLYAGMADVARVAGDASLAEACRRMWKSITEKRMYITGAIGSQAYGETFTLDYDLPNDLVYGETCASVGLIFFAWRMLLLEPKAMYADVMEQALYNSAISGMSMDGKRFFYVNPLEVVPERDREVQVLRHVKTERQKWFACACCPPNLARLVTSLPSYLYLQQGNTVYVNLYMGSQCDFQLQDGHLSVQVETEYPYHGAVKLTIQSQEAFRARIALRLPAWCSGYTLTLDGSPGACQAQDGYLFVDADWQPGRELLFTMEMPAVIMRANANVRADYGKLAVVRGPMVYCLEEADNGPDLHRAWIKPDTAFSCVPHPQFSGGMVALACIGYTDERQGSDRDPAPLYAKAQKRSLIPRELLWIPYYAWANREPGEMRVFVNEL